MTAYELLLAEMTETLRLAAGRNQSIEETAADVVHEMLEAGSDDIDEVATVFVRLRALRKELRA